MLDLLVPLVSKFLPVLFASFLVTLAVPVANGQVAGGGGGGGTNGRFDTNPANSTNWLITTSPSGTLTQQQTTLVFGVPVTATETYNYATSAWSPAPPPGTSYTTGSLSTVPNQSVTFSFDQKVVYTLQWIGIGAVPDHVYVRLSSQSSIIPSGSLTGAYFTDGLQNTPVGTYAVSDQTYKRISISSGSGTTSIEVTGGGSVSFQWPMTLAMITGSGGSSLTIAPRAAKVFDASDTTYQLGYAAPNQPEPVANDVTVTNPAYGDIAAVSSEAILPGQTFNQGTMGTGFSLELFGTWAGFPVTGFGWTASPGTASNSNGSTTFSLSDEYSASDMHGMVFGGPKLYNCSCEVTDPSGSGETITTSYVLRVHAPIEYPSLILSLTQSVDTGKRSASYFNNSFPNGYMFSIEFGWTWSESSSWSAVFTEPLWEQIIINLGYQQESSSGTSTNATYTHNVDYLYNGYFKLMQWQLQNLYGGHAYGIHGYVGETSCTTTTPRYNNTNDFYAQFQEDPSSPGGGG